MANVRLLKDHNGQKKGTIGEVADSRANYLVRVKVAEYVTEGYEAITLPEPAKLNIVPYLVNVPLLSVAKVPEAPKTLDNVEANVVVEPVEVTNVVVDTPNIEPTKNTKKTKGKAKAEPCKTC
ncbi:hypothetical protein [Sphingobacterium faecium]|uniref:hypothetical protein n=1 Tax=Sphingobacterium faecium TaxID=34087 RepID=UPI0024690E6D|nr:hypothetical protein [Sphingobacterium faecium]MDH5825765.1 hypothetical protein [Sphingobacterium faecium]